MYSRYAGRVLQTDGHTTADHAPADGTMARAASDVTGCPDCVATLGWLLWQASYALITELTAAMAQLGVSPRGHCVLSAAMLGEHTQTEIAHIVGLDKTTMVVTVDELEAAGLAERRADPRDRRARLI